MLVTAVLSLTLVQTDVTAPVVSQVKHAQNVWEAVADLKCINIPKCCLDIAKIQL